MQWARPKSLSGLMLLGLALIAFPLLLALFNAALQIRKMADTSQKLVIEGVASARASQELVSQIASLERTALYYGVLNRASFLDDYRRQDDELAAKRDQLDRHMNNPEAHKTLTEFGHLESEIRTAVTELPSGANMARSAALSSRFTDLGKLADQVTAQANAQIDTEVAALEEQTRQSRRKLLL